MPMYISPTSDQHKAAVASLRFIVEATETVDSYTVDYTTPHPDAHNVLIVDRDFLASERVGDVLRVLAELDTIVSGNWEWALMEAVTPEARLRVDTVERARVLAEAIREALGHARPTPSGQGCVSTDHDGAIVPATRVIDGRPLCGWCAEGAEAAKPIAHTGQRARIRNSIIDGQPWNEFEAWVVEIDGDTLTYTTDANPSWFSTATRSEISDWSLIESEVGA